MPFEPLLIIELPRDSAVERRLRAGLPEGVAPDAIVIADGPTDPDGHLATPIGGEVVLSVPSPETLAREAHEVHRVIAGAGTGVEPLVVVVEAAEELRAEELAPLLEAAGHASRQVILRIMREG